MIHGVDEQFIVNRVPVKFFASVVADKKFSLHAAANPNFKSWFKVHSATEALKKKAAALEPKFHAWARPKPDFFENTAERKVNRTRKMKTVPVVKKSKIRFPPLILIYQLCSLRPCLQACVESVEIDMGVIHPKKDTHCYARAEKKAPEEKAAEKKAVEKAMAVREVVRKEAAEQKAAEKRAAAEATASKVARDRAYLEDAYAERAVRENAVEEAKVRALFEKRNASFQPAVRATPKQEARKTWEGKTDSETVDLTSQHQDKMEDMRVDHDRAL
ncbi:unnamed protein product [Zymoseptoria tritici ST99CH_1E4]|uniref:Uncharacterized protein n=1 Tax=Zymoseptoria tritici ST99CH_1E4 TaxID=1276532 RepID=A0A2H1H924_ZYMTR|nr:unnamed protein product [Zymoseptoria tritici ST99CH_1E4]